MSFVLDLISPRPRRPRIHLSRATPPPRTASTMSAEYHDEDPSGSDADHLSRALPPRYPFQASSSSDLNTYGAPSRDLLITHAHPYPRQHSLNRSQYGYQHHAQRRSSSSSSSTSVTPVPSSPVSRTASPSSHLPIYTFGSGASVSSYSSDDESDPDTLLLGTRRHPPWRDPRAGWWITGTGRGARRGRRHELAVLRTCKRVCRRLVRHPFFPKTPFTILLALLFFSAFGVSLTFLIIYILNPDKEPLPWRGYCTIPHYSSAPPALWLPPKAHFPISPPPDFDPPSFPPPGFDDLAPAGVFVGVFTTDIALERRMLIRSTWAAHIRSRNGASGGDGGIGTSRTVVRFIMGQPRKELDRRIRLESETYKDIVILPVPENMNGGKTHSYFSWAASHAWVPPVYFDTLSTVPHNLSYANATSPPPPLAEHDPYYAILDYHADPKAAQPWVHPDFVVKVDDDSFVMLAELEARLRVELHAPPTPPQHPIEFPLGATFLSNSPPSAESGLTAIMPNATDVVPRAISETSNSGSPSDTLTHVFNNSSSSIGNSTWSDNADPLIYWGYLVKNRFMAGELYALSFGLTTWVANDPQVRTMTRGAEDKQTAKWMRVHPRADDVRWVSERCWIYDHPRAGTVYSHGYLFPSEARRIQRGVKFDIEYASQVDAGSEAPIQPSPFGVYAQTPPTWASSTVSKFAQRYTPPLPSLSIPHSIEALVEGSQMSMLQEGGSMTPEFAWKYREGRDKRYENKRVGGTIVVHFIKKHMWFSETALALLDGVRVTDAEKEQEESLGMQRVSGTDARTDSPATKPRRLMSTLATRRHH